MTSKIDLSEFLKYPQSNPEPNLPIVSRLEFQTLYDLRDAQYTLYCYGWHPAPWDTNTMIKKNLSVILSLLKHHDKLQITKM